MTAAPDPANPLLRAALWYARRGWAVLPCHGVTDAGGCSCGAVGCDSVAKHPRTRQGLSDASTHETIVRGWWTRWPEANVAVRTGGDSRLVVLDVDLHEHSGFKTLLDLEAELGKLPETVTAITGSGGHHRYYRSPEGVRIANSVGTVGGLGPGLDVRGDRGYVLLPPSVHETLTRYAWAPGHGPHEHQVADLPAAWVERLSASARPKPEPKTPIPLRPGNRNSSLTSLAGAMRRQGADEATIRETLTTLNGKLPEPLPEGEVGKIAGSVARYAPEPNGDKERRPLTDLGNAERLIDRHGADVRYVVGWGWLVYDGRRWARDPEELAVRRLAQETVRGIYGEAQAELDPERRALLAKHAAASERSARIAALVTEARALPGVAAPMAAFDRDRYALCVRNGTIDLRSGTLLDHRRAACLTRLAAVDFDADATCPVFLAFLDRVFAGDADLTGFVQRALGYGLTSDTSERLVFIAWGGGANGKSTLLEAVSGILGDYAQRVPTTLLMARRQEGIPNDIARLQGVRLAFASETEEGQPLAEAFIKDLTGGDTLTARYLHREFFDFKPECKVWLRTNHKPRIRGTDNAIWDRIKLIPFTVRIPEGERDKHLAAKLGAEAAGILAWAVRGCLAWQAQGLGAPAAVQAATATYRAEEDRLAAFLSERCLRDPAATVPGKELYAAYAAWCEDSGERPVSQKRLGGWLAERGLERRHGMAGWRWQALRLRTPNDPLGGADDPSDPFSEVFSNDALMGKTLDLGSYGSSRSAMGHASAETDSERALENPQPVTEPSPPYPGCWLDGCLAQVADIDAESGDWCADHLERRQLLNHALLLGWPVVDLGGGEMVGGRESWQAFARAASDTEIAFAADALSELPPGGENDG